MVKTLIWSPRDPHRFIVGGGSQITLYEWASEFPEIRHVTSQLDLQYMKVNVVSSSIHFPAYILLVFCMVP